MWETDCTLTGGVDVIDACINWVMGLPVLAGVVVGLIGIIIMVIILLAMIMFAMLVFIVIVKMIKGLTNQRSSRDP